METKPAIYTTEFWTMVVTVILNLLNEVGIWDFISNWHSGILLTIIVAAYQASRGRAKSHVAADPAVAANYRLFPRKTDGVRR